jgi:hypothetical protein
MSQQVQQDTSDAFRALAEAADMLSELFGKNPKLSSGNGRRADSDDDDKAEQVPTIAQYLKAHAKQPSLADLRTTLIENDYDPAQIRKERDRETLLRAMYDVEYPVDEDDDVDSAEDAEEDDDEDDDDYDVDDEADDDDEDKLTREQAAAMGLREIKNVAKEQGYDAAQLKGLDVDGVVSLLFDEDEDDDADDDADDDDEPEYTAANLRGKRIPELQEIVGDLVKQKRIRRRPAKTATVAELRDAILQAM